MIFLSYETPLQCTIKTAFGVHQNGLHFETPGMYHLLQELFWMVKETQKRNEYAEYR